MHPLEPPAAVHELGGQPVEQLGVGRRLAQLAEVVGRRHDSAAEVILPEPIGHHPGRPRVAAVGQPVGQRPSLAGSVRRTSARPRPSTSGTPGSTVVTDAGSGLPRKQHVRLAPAPLRDAHDLDARARSVGDFLQSSCRWGRRCPERRPGAGNSLVWGIGSTL